MKELANRLIFLCKEGEDSKYSEQTKLEDTTMKITTLIRVEDDGKDLVMRTLKKLI